MKNRKNRFSRKTKQHDKPKTDRQMKGEQIEKAAFDHIQPLPFGEGFHDLDIKRAFRAGARWRITEAWHDRTEAASGFALILSENADGTYDLQYGMTKDTRRWAYVSDLIPDDGKEERP